MEQPEPVARSSRVARNQRSESCAPQERAVGSGNPGCRAVSVSHLLDDDDVPLVRDAVLFLCATSWITMLRRGFGFWPGRRQQCRQRLGQDGNPAGPTAASPVSDDRSGQLLSLDGCPATGRISSQPLNGCPAAGGATSNSDRRTGPGTESCVKSAWSGPRCLRRATSNPQRQRSLLGTLGRANHPYGQPGQQGVVPPGFLWLETLANPDNIAIITVIDTEKDPLRHPPQRFPQNC